MEGIKDLLKDPAKLEATIKGAWEKIDAKKEGEVAFDVFKVALKKIAEEMKITEMLPKTEEGAAEFKKTTDPNNTGKVNFDGFKAIIQLGIENMKKEGKF